MQWEEMLISAVSSFAITIILMPFIIGYFRTKQLGQTTREEGPTWHEVKTGTPTMGGVVFLISASATIIWTAIWQNAFTVSLGLLVFILMLYGLLGFLDDYIKLIKKRNLGLTSAQKFIGQVVGGALFYIVYRMQGLPSELNLLGLADVSLGWFYGLVIIFWLVGFSNAVNLTDGLDGLATGTSIIAYSAYAIIAFHQEQIDVLIFCLAVIGGLIGFLGFNKKPARIFMGDVGSLALGGGLAAVSVLLHQEWTLLLIGLIFIVETLSVILQVGSVKLRNKRVFKMAPIHHHFEMSGWSEWRIVITFWTIGLLMALIALWIVL